MQGLAETPVQPAVPNILEEAEILKKRNVDELRQHIQMLTERRVDKRDPTLNGFDEEFYYIETKTASDQFFGDYKSAIQVPNRNKNRYSNVLPPEKTRVKLSCTDSDDQCGDYINANFISGLVDGSEKAYIATQGPLVSTFGDFWRMVWETNSCVIIMLTREVENGRLKCDRYWPDVDMPLTAGQFKLTLLEMPPETDELIERRIELFNIEEGTKREISQFQYIAWPDHGLPVSTDAFLTLASKADDANKTKGPLVVHCSAGIGRSGTFCTVHATIERIKEDIAKDSAANPLFNIVETVLFMRSMRPGMVQTKEQYMFCCYAIVEEAERLLGRETQSKLQLNNLSNGVTLLQTDQNNLVAVADKTGTDVLDSNNNN
jgi:protein tyrosine phosphatase